MHNTAYVVGYAAQEYDMTIICPPEGCALLLSCNEYSDECVSWGFIYTLAGANGILIFTTIFLCFILIIILITQTIMQIYKECAVIEKIYKDV